MDYKYAVRDLQEHIMNEDYFHDVYEIALANAGMNKRGVAYSSYTNEALNNMLNNFWFELPDTQTIRREPFFRLCELCQEFPPETPTE